MLDFLSHLFDPSGFPARWNCGDWTPAHGWLHILSDLAIWGAYFTIPCILSYFVVRRRDIPFSTVFWLFGTFILACGTTHLMEAIIFWHPAYRLAGVIKLLTAVVSWGTVVALVPIVPKALAMRSPDELEREIAARKQAEDALQRANAGLEMRVKERTALLAEANANLQYERERLRITLESIGDAVIVTDTDGRVTFLNAIAQMLTGWKDDEAKGLPLENVFRIINEQSRESAENPATRALTGGTIVGHSNHAILIAKDGAERAIDDSAAPIRYETGALAGVVLVFRDIVERRRAEELLRESTEALRAKEAELDLVITQTPLLLTRCSRDLRYVFVNRACAEFLGASPEAIIGRPIAEIMGPDAFATIRPYVDKVLGGEQAEFEIEVPYARGRRFMRVLYTPDRDELGNVIGWVGTINDISDRKQMEREREERAAELAVALDKRTAEARRAENAERQLREADQHKDEFLATLAHELRNPMAPLRNALEVLRLSEGNKSLFEQARGILERQVKQLARLVDDLLDISRISRGKMQVRKERVVLGDAIKAAIETVHPIVERSALNLTVTEPPDAIHVQADPIRLAQVILNLLHNAAKYTDKGGHIWLTVERQGGDVIVSVRDTGIGIAAEHLHHIFEMFSQGTSALERSHDGLGIGLSLVKGLVELHGGAVAAQSGGPGMGSEFTVRLPIVDASAAPTTKTEAVGQDGGKARRCRILVVDDLRDAADSLAKMLELTGHETRTAYDGLEALQTATTFQPHIVLLDIGLPKMNGYDVARHIRNEPWGGKMALVALTGWGQEADKRRSVDAGIDHHLTKPVDPATLKKLLALINADLNH